MHLTFKCSTLTEIRLKCYSVKAQECAQLPVFFHKYSTKYLAGYFSHLVQMGSFSANAPATWFLMATVKLDFYDKTLDRRILTKGFQKAFSHSPIFRPSTVLSIMHQSKWVPLYAPLILLFQSLLWPKFPAATSLSSFNSVFLRERLKMKNAIIGFISKMGLIRHWYVIYC